MRRIGLFTPLTVAALAAAVAVGCTSAGPGQDPAGSDVPTASAATPSETSGAPQLQGPTVDLLVDGAPVKVDDVCVDGDDVSVTVDGGMTVHLQPGQPDRVQVVRDGVTMTAEAQVDDTPGMTAYRTTVADEQGRMSVDVAVGVFSLDGVPSCPGR